MSYIYELWIGKEKKYWNWELKGLEGQESLYWCER